MTTTHPLLGIGVEAEAIASRYSDPDLADFVRGLAITGLMTASINKNDDWIYPSYELMCLDLGAPMTAPLYCPDEIVGEPQECFLNCWRVATDLPGWTYVEGYAMASLFPTPHAWLIDPEGRLVDPTWVNLDFDFTPYYCGIQFDTEYIIKASIRSGWASVLSSDWRGATSCLQNGFVLDGAGVVIGDALPALALTKENV